MSNLTFQQVRDAVAGGGVAFRSRTVLEPAGGPGDKVFPPTYVPNSTSETKYAVEQRILGDRESTTVLLDSVASQANRAELALLEGWDAGELAFPVPFVDFGVDAELADIGRLTALDAPHRIADAIFRDSLLDNTLFRLSDMGRAITDANPRDASALFKYSPTALLFGMWDSTGPKGGLGSKFQRAFVSEIVGLDAQFGTKVGSRIDPLQIEIKAGPLFEHADAEQRWTLDAAEATKEKGEPKKLGKDGRPSEANHGNIAPSLDSHAGGVTISEALQTTVISLAALRRLRFAGWSADQQLLARTAIAALGIAAIAYQHELDFDLRSRCLLIPKHAPRLELLTRDGKEPSIWDVDRAGAGGILAEASTQLKSAGIPWETAPIRLVPAPKLIELLKRSRKLAAESPVE